ncbi:MAG: outer rane beta-barrel protein [Flavipsychrobacter sp.]|nr:outer rane beta-barrel protein [Flavipsychrobacter sp.]
MKYLCTLILFVFAMQHGAAQPYLIKGSVTDTLNSASLHRSSVTIIRTTDSVIESFTRTGANGRFELQVAKPGKYVLQITFPSFADYVEVINVKNNTTDLGDIAMVSKEHLLKEFVITKQIAAIKIKGDTTEYMADSFKVKDNANVEDLLKKLPGIQVDKNGQITAQGETVQKVLVDGEEFFSDDPKVVTQGLQANGVEKVQVYDKKSDQATFTGIDDGEKTKTINLELKENKKKGYFGKIDAGGGTNGYYQNQGMLNAFRGKRQLSAFSIISNTDKVGLGWQENDKYGGGSGETEITDDGTWNMVGGVYDDFGGWSGNYSGQGLPKVWTGGLHFANKWNADKDHVTANYRYAQQNVEINGDNKVQSALSGDTTRINTEHKNQFSKAERNGIDAMFEWKMDSSSSIRLIANGGNKLTDVYSGYYTETYNKTPGDGLHTKNDRVVTSKTNNQFINSDLLYRKKFAKKGRSLSIDLKENYKDAKSDGHLNSVTTIPGITPSNIDQKKINNNSTLSFATKAIYTEPLSKKAFLEANYGVTVNNSDAENFSYDKAPGSNTYGALNDTVSSDYKYNILTNQGGLKFKYVYKKINFSFGSDVSNTGYMQTDVLHGDTSHTYNYVNLFPQANFNFKMAKQTSISLSYQGSTKQPTITQIQPFVQNTDPLNITIGNPALKQQFTNKVNFHFNDYRVLSHRYIYANLNFSTIADAISTAQTIAGPVSKTQYVNVDGNYSGGGWAGFGFKLKKPEMNIRLNLETNVSHTNNFINGQKNTNNNNSYTFSPEFNYEKEDKYDYSLEPSVTYNNNKSTINIYSTNYWVFNTELRGSRQLPKKFEISSSVDLMVRQKTVVFTDNNQVVKWNASVSKKFLKKDAIELKLSVFDILNQNIGYTRTAQGSTITQDSYNTIRRYGMLSVIWNITHSPLTATTENK